MVKAMMRVIGGRVGSTSTTCAKARCYSVVTRSFLLRIIDTYSSEHVRMYDADVRQILPKVFGTSYALIEDIG